MRTLQPTTYLQCMERRLPHSPLLKESRIYHLSQTQFKPSRRKIPKVVSASKAAGYHSIVWRNGCVETAPDINLQRVLRELPNGAYTTALINSQLQCINWQQHILQLAGSVRTLHGEARLFDALISNAERKAQNLEDVVHNLLREPLRQVLTSISMMDQAAALVLVMALCPSTASSEGVSILIVLTPARQQHAGAPVQAVVLGGPRTWPHAKHIEWLRQRQPLEQMKPEGYEEVLLCSEDGEVLEGLVTNFCVIQEREDGSPVLRTAGPAEPVYWGTMLGCVVRACRLLGLEVDMRAPRLDERGQWVEAFTTNSVRGITPVKRVMCSLGRWDMDIKLPQEHGPITKQLQAALPAVQQQTALSDIMTPRVDDINVLL